MIELNNKDLITSKKTLSPQYLHPPNETTGKLGEIPSETRGWTSQKRFYILPRQKPCNQKLSPQYLFPPNDPGPTQYQHQRLIFRPRNEETPKKSQELSPQYLFPPNISLFFIVALNILQYYFLIVVENRGRDQTVEKR